MRSPSDDNGTGEILSRVEERSARLRDVLRQAQPDFFQDFRDKLLLSWIYHDNALEGVVLTSQELQSALDQEPGADFSLIPSYDEILAQKVAIAKVHELSARRRGGLTLDLIKQIYATMCPGGDDAKLVRYRKETPLHRLYFHEISPPEKISYRMRRLLEWVGSPQAKNMHPIKMAAKTHFRLMHIYPFPKSSGKLARMVMNLLLLRNGYQPAIIHATERQRYYDALRTPHSGLTRLICESLLNSVDGALKVLDENPWTESAGNGLR